MKNNFKKYDIDEPIQIGDLISYWAETNTITRAFIPNWKDNEHNKVLGVCTNINDDIIEVTSTGIVDVNVESLVCLGDKLTASDIKGKAKAIKYNQDETQFRYRHIGKVIGLYNSYNVVKVLLDIE